MFLVPLVLMMPLMLLRGWGRRGTAHVVDSEDIEDSNTRRWDQLYVVDNRLTSSGRWWKRDFPFPCPLAGHDHDLSTCKEFHKMTPKERQVECQGRICKTCLKAGEIAWVPRGNVILRSLRKHYAKGVLRFAPGISYPPTTCCFGRGSR